jgi:curli biogenesis system outer membrane secretion channel CsgG
MTRKMVIALLLACAAASAAHAGCPGDKSITYKDPVPVAPLDPLPQGSRIGVKDLRVEGFEFTRQHDPDFVAKYLSQILSNYGSYYRVVERQQLGDIQEELKLVESGTVQAGRDGKAPMSSAKSADYIVTGSITNPQVGSIQQVMMVYNSMTHKLKYSKSFMDNVLERADGKSGWRGLVPKDVQTGLDIVKGDGPIWVKVPGQVVHASAFVDIKVIDAQNAEVVRQFTQTVSKQVCSAVTKDGTVTDVEGIIGGFDYYHGWNGYADANQMLELLARMAVSDFAKSLVQWEFDGELTFFKLSGAPGPVRERTESAWTLIENGALVAAHQELVGILRACKEAKGDQALKGDPFYAAGIANLALIEDACGQTERARDRILRACELKPDCDELVEHRARLEKKLQRATGVDVLPGGGDTGDDL